jgi:hypothetical protein
LALPKPPCSITTSGTGPEPGSDAGRYSRNVRAAPPTVTVRVVVPVATGDGDGDGEPAWQPAVTARASTAASIRTMVIR